MSKYRDEVLQSLERTCRTNAEIFFRLMANLTNDAQATQYGAPASCVAYGLPMSKSTVRRTLEAEVAAGRVLRHKLSYGPVTYWPVGLWVRLQ